MYTESSYYARPQKWSSALGELVNRTKKNLESINRSGTFKPESSYENPTYREAEGPFFQQNIRHERKMVNTYKLLADSRPSSGLKMRPQRTQNLFLNNSPNQSIDREIDLNSAQRFD